MAVTLEGLLEGVNASRQYFLKHLKDLPQEAWTFKPYTECKNVLETLAHLRIDDQMAAESIVSLKEPDYEAATGPAYAEMEKGPEHLLGLLEESHSQLFDLIRSRFEGKPIDSEICVWGNAMPLYRGIPYLSSEDYYHAGQVSFIRMAVQPDWDYYAAIFGT